MRIVLGGLLALSAVAAASTVSAQGAPNPVCAAYKRNFDRVSGSDDAGAMTKALQDIPAACESLRQDARAAIAASRKRATDRENARKAAEQRRLADQALADRHDDAAFDSAVAGNTISGFDAYLSAYPAGRHVYQARTNRQALIDAAKPKHVSLNLCNKSGVDLNAAVLYQKVGDTQNWRFVGWYRVANNECRVLFETDNRTFYIWANAVTGTTFWGDKDVEGRKASNGCYVMPGPYDFSQAAGLSCPANATMKPFLSLYSNVASGVYTFTLN